MTRLLCLLAAFALFACSGGERSFDFIPDPTPPKPDSVFSTLPGEPVAASEQSVVRNCVAPWGLHELVQPYVIQRVNSRPELCDTVYYESEPVRWDIGADAAAPRRADGHLRCRWRTPLTWPGQAGAISDACRAGRSFVCDYMQGTLTYSVAYFARTDDWTVADVQVQVSGSQTPSCTRLLTTSFPLSG
jgi:hypothetical protein